MQKILIAIFLLISIVVISTVILPKTLLKPKAIHIHAGFQLYHNDKIVDFSGPKYMHEEPCTVNGKPVNDPNADDQEEKAHLHDHIGDVVHVHRTNATWSDLFINIKYPVDKNVIGYINGKKVDAILNQKIEPYQSVVFFEGSHVDNEKYLKNAINKKYIESIEKKSETCSS